MPVAPQLVSYYCYSNGRFPMSLIDNAQQNSWFFSGKFLDHLDPHIILIHGTPMEAEHKLILRFQNGFGVEILQSFFCRERPPLFKVLVLQFIGPRMKDFKTFRIFIQSNNKLGQWIWESNSPLPPCGPPAWRGPLWGTNLREKISLFQPKGSWYILPACPPGG